MALDEEQEQEPFLLHEKDNNTDSSPKSSEGNIRTPSSSSKWKTWKLQLLAHSLLITIYTLLSLTFILIHNNTTSSSSSAPPPPAISNLPLSYTPSLFQNLSQSPFAGKPSPEIDAAWDELLAPMHIRVTEAELRRTNQESVALTEEERGGYLAWLGVFHELHCIKMLREWHYKAYYHADAPASEKEHIASHIDHCFEFLRQSSVCRADVSSLTTFKWHPAKTRPMFNASESVHSCVDWEGLMGSLKGAGRVVSDEEVGRLRNPLLENRT